ncbi:phosphodiester glycosidase family protein [Candidatus Chlorohelix sp.]|uniref:phosphodiester glycosidase family protein n=1 Tax=Candidatus Chlorohelix sp. TaxID=3139201 RepID=UPI0030247942
MKLFKAVAKLKVWFAFALLAVVLGTVVSITLSQPSNKIEAVGINTSLPTVTSTLAPTIEVIAATATPSATATPKPTPSPTPLPTATPLPFSDRFDYKPKDVVRQVRPGVVYIRRELTSPGPLKINIMLFDLTAPEFDLRVVMKNGYLSGVSPTSKLLKEFNGLAAVNGDLFSGQGLPQGLVISDGKVAMAPKYRATFALTKDKLPFIGYFTQDWTWPSTVSTDKGEKHSLQLLNNTCSGGRGEDLLCIYNEMARTVAGRSGDIKVMVTPNNMVLDIDYTGKEWKISEGYNVLLARQGTDSWRWLKQNAVQYEPLHIMINTNYNLGLFQQAVSGGPIILKDGKFNQDCLCNLSDCSQVTQKQYQGTRCEEFDLEWKMSHYLTTRMPRTGIGYNDKKTLLVVAQSDGYQPGFSIGTTQKEFADLFLEFGATTAMELDGGGSSTMALDGKLVSRPSDGSGMVERQVPNAVVFYWKDPPFPRNIVNR